MPKSRGRPACKVYTVEWKEVSARKTQIRAKTAAEAKSQVKKALGRGGAKRIAVECSSRRYKR